MEKELSRLDFQVAHGIDVPDAKTAFDVLIKTETVIEIFYIPADAINPLEEAIATKLIPLKYTMKIHQVVAVEMFLVKHRELSCFCQDGKCDCYSLILHSFEINEHHSIITEEILDEVTGIIHSKAIKKNDEDEEMQENNNDTIQIDGDLEEIENTAKISKAHQNKKKYREM